MMVPKCACGPFFPLDRLSGKSGGGVKGTRQWGGLSSWGAASRVLDCSAEVPVLARARLRLFPVTEVGNTVDKVGRHFFPPEKQFQDTNLK